MLRASMHVFVYAFVYTKQVCFGKRMQLASSRSACACALNTRAACLHSSTLGLYMHVPACAFFFFFFFFFPCRALISIFFFLFFFIPFAAEPDFGIYNTNGPRGGYHTPQAERRRRKQQQEERARADSTASHSSTPRAARPRSHSWSIGQLLQRPVYLQHMQPAIPDCYRELKA